MDRYRNLTQIKRFMLTALFLGLAVIVFAQGNYYDSAMGLTGNALKNQLRIIMTDYFTLFGDPALYNHKPCK